MDRFTTWRAAERFFAEFFGSSITRLDVILCLHPSFLLFKLFFLLLILDEYDLE